MSRKKSFNKRNQNLNFLESLGTNNLSHFNYSEALLNICLAKGHWLNMPDTIDTRFLELGLALNGAMVGFKDDVIGMLCLPFAQQGTLDIYQVPTGRYAYADNGYHATLTNENSVICWNNLTRTPSMPVIQYYAKRLYDLDATIDVNAKAQKTPILILCDENQRLSLKNVYMQYTGNQPVIYGSANLLDNASFQVLNTQAPYVADKLYTLKTQIWNDAVSRFGTFNNPEIKKERLTNKEILHSSGITHAMAESLTLARQNFCKQFNAMFNLNTWYEPATPEEYAEITGFKLTESDAQNE